MLIRFFSPKAARETTTVLGGHLAYVCGGLVLSKLLAYHLGPNGFGEWALVYSIVGVINLLAHGPVGQWLLRFYSLWRLEGALGSYEKFSSLLLSYGFLAGSFLLVPLVFNLELRSTHYLLSIAIAFLFGNNLILQNIFTAKRNRRLAAGVMVVDSWLKVVAAWIVFHYLQKDLTTWVVAFGLCSFITAGIFNNRRDMPFKFVFSHKSFPWSEFITYSSPFLIMGVLGALVTQVDKWVVASTATGEELGLYAAALLVGSTPFHLLGYFISQLSVPTVFDLASGKGPENLASARSRINWVAIITGITSVSLLALIWLFSETLIRLLTSSDFLRAKDLIIPLAISAGLFQVAQALGISAMVVERTSTLLWPKMWHSLVFLIIAVPLAHGNGAEGVAWAHLISAAVYLVLMTFLHFKLRDSGNRSRS